MAEAACYLELSKLAASSTLTVPERTFTPRSHAAVSKRLGTIIRATSSDRLDRFATTAEQACCDGTRMDLVVGTIDDSKLISKGYERILLPMLSADVDKSIICCPKTGDEVRQFVDQVSGRFDGNFADVVLLDQNIELKNGVVLGTDLAQELRARDYNGVVVIRSAHGAGSLTPAEGTVNLIMGKDASIQSIATPILEALLAKKKASLRNRSKRPQRECLVQ